MYYSLAHYTATDEGVIDVETASSAGGSYEGVFPAGLIVSIQPGPGMKPHARLLKHEVYKPFEYVLTAHQGHTDFENLSSVLSTITLKRYYATPDIRRIPIRHGRLRGTLFLPPGEGPFPAVLDLWGGMGGLVEFRAAICASKGLASFALAYYGYDDLDPGPENVDAIYISEGVDYLLSRPEVIPDQCGVVSHCLGTFYGLAASIFDERIKAVIGISPIAFGFGINLKYNGEQLMKRMEPHFYTMDFINDIFLTFNKELYTTTYLHAESEYLIPIERAPSDTHYLLSAGNADTYYSHIANNSLKTRRNRAGKGNIDVIEYEGGGHILEVPHGPLIKTSYQPYYPFREGGPPNLPGKRGVVVLKSHLRCLFCSCSESSIALPVLLLKSVNIS